MVEQKKILRVNNTHVCVTRERVAAAVPTHWEKVVPSFFLEFFKCLLNARKVVIFYSTPEAKGAKFMLNQFVVKCNGQKGLDAIR